MPIAPTRRTRATWHAAAVAVCVLMPAATWTLTASPASALVQASEPGGAVSFPMAAAPPLASPDRRSALESAAAWRGFRERHGDWRAAWNAATGSPHRAVGPAIPLVGFAGDSASVDRAIRAFVAANAGVFGAATVIEPRSVRSHGGTWYASYRQMVGGLEVLFADWEFRVSASGRLVLFGADAYAFSPPATRAAIAPAAARVAATTGLDFVAGRDVVESAGAPALLPLASPAGQSARLVLPVRVRTAAPVASWFTLVDAVSGEVVMRVNQARPLAGHVTALVHPELPTDPLSPLPLEHEYVFVGADSTVTDASGAYDVPSSGPVTLRAELRGPYIDVNRA